MQLFIDHLCTLTQLKLLVFGYTPSSEKWTGSSIYCWETEVNGCSGEAKHSNSHAMQIYVNLQYCLGQLRQL